MNEYVTEIFRYGNGSDHYLRSMIKNGWHLHSITDVPAMVSSTMDVVIVMFRPMPMTAAVPEIPLAYHE